MTRMIFNLSNVPTPRDECIENSQLDNNASWNAVNLLENRRDEKQRRILQSLC